MKKFFLNLIALPFLSRIYGHLTRMKRPRCLVQLIIKRFVAHYRIDLDHYQGQLADFRSLADFFVRPLNPATRPLHPDPSCILSPCDGKVADLQKISCDKAVQAKGLDYPVSALIGEKLDWSREWWLCTLYLSPANYHRFHYPWTGRLQTIRQLGNRLYPVNRHGVQAIPGLFVRNERLVLCFDLAGWPAYATAVGATFVGSIALRALENRTLDNGCVTIAQNIEQLEEMGRFNLGSTIILLFPSGLAEPVVETGQAINTGQPVFRFRH